VKFSLFWVKHIFNTCGLKTLLLPTSFSILIVDYTSLITKNEDDTSIQLPYIKLTEVYVNIAKNATSVPNATIFSHSSGGNYTSVPHHFFNPTHHQISIEITEEIF
jgi:hypothetical protein